VVDTEAGGCFTADRVEQQLRGHSRPSAPIVPATALARARVSGVRAVLSSADIDVASIRLWLADPVDPTT
jgi:hypothetical protein